MSTASACYGVDERGRGEAWVGAGRFNKGRVGIKVSEIDVIMFSVNPAYDILPPNEDVDTLFEKSTYDAPDVLSSTDPERLELYSLCESEGVALTVMKPYGGAYERAALGSCRLFGTAGGTERFCGACEKRCSFGVKIIEHMQRACEIFCV